MVVVVVVVEETVYTCCILLCTQSDHTLSLSQLIDRIKITREKLPSLKMFVGFVISLFIDSHVTSKICADVFHADDKILLSGHCREQ